jgi:hypothetical protein
VPYGEEEVLIILSLKTMNFFSLPTAFSLQNTSLTSVDFCKCSLSINSIIIYLQEEQDNLQPDLMPDYEESHYDRPHYDRPPFPHRGRSRVRGGPPPPFPHEPYGRLPPPPPRYMYDDPYLDYPPYDRFPPYERFPPYDPYFVSIIHNNLCAWE